MNSRADVAKEFHADTAITVVQWMQVATNMADEIVRLRFLLANRIWVPAEEWNEHFRASPHIDTPEGA
jgi:hypothetical protein